MSDLLKIPVQDPLLEEILRDLPKDYDWNEADPIEKIYKKQGLVRYYLDVNTMQSVTTSVEDWINTCSVFVSKNMFK